MRTASKTTHLAIFKIYEIKKNQKLSRNPEINAL